jgi:NDP-sugar pyrophosphorylase family protein
MPSITPIILAGGKGSRLAPVLSDLPKPLAPVQGRPFITYMLDLLIAAGFKHVVIATGYLGHKFSNTLGSNYHSLRITYSHEKIQLDTGGAIRNALRHVRNSERLLVMNGDSLMNLNLRDFTSWSIDYPETMVLTFAKDCGRFGSVETDNGDKVIAFHEKRAIGKSGWINAGIYLLSQKLISSWDENGPLSIEHECLPKISARGGLFGFKKVSDFIDIGIPETYKLVCDKQHWITRLF